MILARCRSAALIAIILGMLAWCPQVWGGGLSLEMEGMLRQCAPNVHPETMAAVISAESAGQQFALADAGPKHLPWSQRKTMVRSFYFPTLEAAAETARNLIAAGHTVSIGAAQINDRNLPRLGLTIEKTFDLCTNLRAGDQILSECYTRASKQYGAGGKALRAALSCYNSGDFVRGDKDGYVDLVIGKAGKSLVWKSGKSPVPSVSASAGLEGFQTVGTQRFAPRPKPGKISGYISKQEAKSSSGDVWGW